MTRILLTGKNGQVGWELQRTLATLGDVIALDRHGLDLADPDSIRRVVREIKPYLIVNAAAYTAVDKAEEEPDLAMVINGIAPGILAEEAKKLGAALIHYSTDYVFDGNKDGPYTEDDAPNPLNVYGKTKLAGEQAIRAVGAPHLIFRTSWVYGMRGKNFLLTILRLAKERDELRIVNDQIGAPTWCRMVAETTAQVVVQLSCPQAEGWSEGTSGIYHLTAADQTSWFGFAKAILNHVSRPAAVRLPRLTPVTTQEYPTPAKRPRNSVLSNTRLRQRFGLWLPGWEIGLRLSVEESIK
ncbi:MAG: dTDP-4-dehydrorhamnose reductase [Sulfuricaulis sp.]